MSDLTLGQDVKPEGEFATWCILELMGHRRLAGYMTESELAGGKFLRLDIYEGDGLVPVNTQFYSPSAVYCITPSTEDTCRKVAKLGRVAPVQPYELQEF